MLTRRVFTTSALTLLGAVLRAQQDQANYDETKVPAYTLPDVLANSAGAKIRTAGQWRERRADLLTLFSRYMYGRTPGGLPECRVRTVGDPVAVLDGRGWRQLLRLEWDGQTSVDVLVYRPRHERRVPVFVGLNFWGNHAIEMDPAIPLSTRWMRSNDANGIVDHRATERSRGVERSRWPIDLIIERDCAVMTAYYGDFAPDHPSVVHDGISRLATGKQQGIPEHERWGAIGMWAWGLSQMRRAAESLPGLDAGRAAAIGHSRLGKAALWAAAQDERFAMVVSNDSGEGGASLSRRMYGETIADITRSFPHWFCPTLATYATRVPELPIDQHQLLALIAPRVLHVASAVDDRWADPKGEFLSAQAADPVWSLLGVRGLGVSAMPGLEQPVGARLRYHVRTGGHDINRYDWTQYLATVRDELT